MLGSNKAKRKLSRWTLQSWMSVWAPVSPTWQRERVGVKRSICVKAGLTPGDPWFCSLHSLNVHSCPWRTVSNSLSVWRLSVEVWTVHGSTRDRRSCPSLCSYSTIGYMEFYFQFCYTNRGVYVKQFKFQSFVQQSLKGTHLELGCAFAYDSFYSSQSREELFSYGEDQKIWTEIIPSNKTIKNTIHCQQGIDFPHRIIKDSFDHSKYNPGNFSVRTQTILSLIP